MASVIGGNFEPKERTSFYLQNFFFRVKNAELTKIIGFYFSKSSLQNS